MARNKKNNRARLIRCNSSKATVARDSVLKCISVNINGLTVEKKQDLESLIER